MVAGMALAGFSSGGYTGDGGKFEPKGVVHGGEFVLRKEVVQLPGMRGYLEGLNKRGYASGGYVGGASDLSVPSFSMPSTEDRQAETASPPSKGVVVNLHEDASRAGQVKATTGPDGRQFVDAYVSNIKTQGQMAKVLEETYGLKRRGR